MCLIKMKIPSRKLNSHQVSVLDSSVTFESFRFIKSKSLPKSPSDQKCKELHKNLNFTPSKSLTNIQSSLFLSKNYNKSDLKFSDVESNITPISHINNLKSLNILWQHNPENTSVVSESVFTNIKEAKYQSYDGNNSALSVSTQEINSDESFLKIMTRKKKDFEFINPKEKFPDFSKVPRLFNKNGKPLTDRMGRPLVDILGQALVVLDSQGRLISDARGNQVFNTLGESAIYSSTNLYLSPSDEEPGIPLLDIDKKHILFLYDNKGHPLTDSLGRPLIDASGNLMIGMYQNEKINVNNYKENQLKSIYGKAPLENFVRRVQIFDSDFQPLTDENGKILKEAQIVCNKGGMPLCDKDGYPLFFKYGARIISHKLENPNSENNHQEKEIHHEPRIQKTPHKTGESVELITHIDKKKSSERTSSELNVSNDVSNDENSNFHMVQFENNLLTINDCLTDMKKLHNEPATLAFDSKFCIDEDTNKKLEVSVNAEPQQSSMTSLSIIKPNNVSSKNLKDISSLQEKKKLGIEKRKNLNKGLLIFETSKNTVNKEKSLTNAAAINSFKSIKISHIIKKRKENNKVCTTNFIQNFKDALNLTTLKKNNNNAIYNDYGKPVKDIHGNSLYDKFGIPLTGAQGRKLSDKAKHTLRMKLRDIPILPVNKENAAGKSKILHALTCNELHDQFGNPYYDKHGRPLYDIYGNLIYDTFGRPMTDAYGRPLIDEIGQPLMDSRGYVLTAGINTTADTIPTDLFGRHLYDKHGRPLFDSYGRPRFDIFTNAIYDSCGRPTTDGNGNILFDFLNKPIKPYPEKPLCKNARASLPRFIDNILAMPSLRRVMKYSWTSLTDIFGGPLFDDFGRPLYNRIGKPLYDKYGRPLYNKDGKPLCDCYGRPLSEEIRKSPDDQTLSVVDSLKLLQLTKESNKWMEVKRSQTQNLKSTDSGILEKAFVMKVVQPAKKKSTQYTYALTRVTTFSCGRQALEILEAPLSPSTSNEMHHLPVDNKPLIIMARRRHKVTRKFRSTKHLR